MKRRWKITLGVLAGLAVLVAVNAVMTGNQTKEAATTVAEGQILSLSRGDVQIVDTGPPQTPSARTRSGAADGPVAGQPIVLLHCYTCSLRWFDGIEPLLAAEHRVIRVDLLGHGGSEKPEAGYEIDNQAALVAEVLNELDVQGAMVVGHSMGAMVATSLAEQASQLVDRAVVIDMAPNTSDFGDGLPLASRISRLPVIGEALWRITPDFAIRDSLDVSFAPGYDVEAGFTDPDVPVEDLRAMSYNSYDTAAAAGDDFVEDLPLDERFKTAPVPLLVIFGAEDQLFDAQAATAGFADVPGVRSEIVAEAGHAPQVEKPAEVAELIEGFAVDLEPVRPRAGTRAKPPAGKRSRPKRDKPMRRAGDRAGRKQSGQPPRNRQNQNRQRKQGNRQR